MITNQKEIDLISILLMNIISELDSDELTLLKSCLTMITWSKETHRELQDFISKSLFTEHEAENEKDSF